MFAHIWPTSEGEICRVFKICSTVLIRHILVKKNIVMYIQQWQDEHRERSRSTTVTSSKITVKMSKLYQGSIFQFLQYSRKSEKILCNWQNAQKTVELTAASTELNNAR